MKFDKISLQKILTNLKNMNLSVFLSTRRYFVAAVSLVVVAVGLVAFLLLVQLTHIFDEINVLHAEQKSLATLKQKVEDLSNTAFLQQADNQRKIDILLPSKKPLLQLLNNTGQAVRDANVALESIETSPGRIASGSAQLQSNVQFAGEAPTTKINGVDVLTIGLTVNGTLAQINTFLKNMEQITPISDITQLQLVTNGTLPTESGLYQAKLRVASYYFTQPVSLSVDSPLPIIQGNEQNFLNNINQFKYAAEAPQETIQGGGLGDLFGGRGSQ